MSEFDSLLDAVKRGDAGEVSAIVQRNPELVNQRDADGATALHYAALQGNRAVVQALVNGGADVNIADTMFGATPAGWAIEYLRELGGFLGIELADLAFAIRQGDVTWVRRFLERFPALRTASDTKGHRFKQLADQSENPEIIRLFQSSE